MLITLAVWVPLALPVQEPKADPPVKTTNNEQRTTNNTPWTPKDRETVVLLGSAFIEQEARDGYLETELIRLFPNKDIRVRNLGWSGDTVHCQARSYFGPPDEGFERLRGHLQMIKPTTVICCYGANESWKGEPGIPDFRKGYERLIDMIRQTTGAAVVLMTPPEYLPKGNAEKELEAANVRLRRYWQEIGYVANAKKCSLIDLGERFAQVQDRFGLMARTRTNGVDLTPFGYEAIAHFFLSNGDSENHSAVDVDLQKGEIRAPNSNVTDVSKASGNLRWTQLDRTLPSLYSFDVPTIGVHVPEGTYQLRIDGRVVESLRYTRADHSKRVVASDSLVEQQARDLRKAIVKKNALFFHRWRPANETYLYGFRKHEQGNNGVEPPQFDKLVEQAEAEIARLKKPVPHKYELIRVEEKK